MTNQATIDKLIEMSITEVTAHDKSGNNRQTYRNEAYRYGRCVQVTGDRLDDE